MGISTIQITLNVPINSAVVKVPDEMANLWIYLDYAAFGGLIGSPPPDSSVVKSYFPSNNGPLEPE
ncbi:hypothetical protein ACTXT7_014163 [Hymenolepis weldensis]